ncbi:GGDEF domain-containing protein [Nocardioides panacihumi]|uniref:GGDEF domain-containing protein n=1 Tax=Nocardioides panacihumi TaxID=400774 RepID=A0ABN2QRQ7_9ACTN
MYRLYLVATMVATLVLPVALMPFGHERGQGSAVGVALVIVVASVLNVEIGRWLEGGMSGSQRPHKALSAWAFASALLLPTWWLLPVVSFTYAHAWWRGLRVPVWKWIGSGAYLVLCGTTAAVTAAAIAGPEVDLMAGSGLRGLVAVLAAAGAFLAVETLLFHGSAYLNRPESEVWLRKTLRSRSFYLTETGVLLVGGLSAAIWTGAAWFLVLLIPVYGLTQRAVLHEPLQERADGDEKTGVLRFEAWRRVADLGTQRCLRRGEPWAVLFADIDHFKRFNDTWGHLAGDRALAAVAQTLVRTVAAAIGDRGVVGRFGGEEFCVFLRSTELEATELADRIRAAVAQLDMAEGSPLTVSVGLASVPPGALVGIEAALDHADRALFQAKEAGRNATRVQLVGIR